MKLVIIDDHPVVRRGIRSILESEDDMTVCGEAEDFEGALELITRTNPDLAIVDIELKGAKNGIQLIQKLRHSFDSLLSLVMSMDDGTLYARRALRAGARGYVAKEEASDTIVNAIRTVMSGEIYISEDLKSRIENSRTSLGSETVDVSILSNREFEIFTLIGKGYKRSEISQETGLNINTIESHRRKIKEKLSLENSAELSRKAVEWCARNK
jgi:DNA-binding NarL/FixJ family response regulator